MKSLYRDNFKEINVQKNLNGWNIIIGLIRIPLALNKWMLFQTQFQHNPSGIWQSDLKICLEEKGTRKTKSEGKKSNLIFAEVLFI